MQDDDDEYAETEAMHADPADMPSAPIGPSPEQIQAEIDEITDENGHISAAKLPARFPDGTYRKRPKDVTFTDELILWQVHQCYGGVYLAAEALGCSPNTIYARARVNHEIAEAMRFYRGRMADKAEHKLDEAIDRGDAWAVQFTLGRLGKRRGYVERTEQRVSAKVKNSIGLSFLAPDQLAGLSGLSGSPSPPALPPATDPTDAPDSAGDA